MQLLRTMPRVLICGETFVLGGHNMAISNTTKLRALRYDVYYTVMGFRNAEDEDVNI